jgi:hypothetical protein
MDGRQGSAGIVRQREADVNIPEEVCRGEAVENGAIPLISLDKAELIGRGRWVIALPFRESG